MKDKIIQICVKVECNSRLGDETFPVLGLSISGRLYVLGNVGWRLIAESPEAPENDCEGE